MSIGNIFFIVVYLIFVIFCGYGAYLGITTKFSFGLLKSIGFYSSCVFIVLFAEGFFDTLENILKPSTKPKVRANFTSHHSLKAKSEEVSVKRIKRYNFKNIAVFILNLIIGAWRLFCNIMKSILRFFGIKKKPYLKSKYGLRGIYIKKRYFYLSIRFILAAVACFAVFRYLNNNVVWFELSSAILVEYTVAHDINYPFFANIGISFLVFLILFIVLRRDSLIKRFICPVCLKTIFTREFNITCPFCDDRIGNVEFGIFKKHSTCGSVLKFADCPKCDNSIDLFRPYDEELFERRRYERT